MNMMKFHYEGSLAGVLLHSMNHCPYFLIAPIIFFNMRNPKYTNPHDRFFKESFSRIDIAGSFIREYLPEQITGQLDLKTLSIKKDTFIDKELSEHLSDTLYSIKIKDNRDCFIYMLFEHKSFIDPFTGFQLLRNMVKIWELYLKQNKRVKKLPVIVPVIFYQGRKPWPYKDSITHLFEHGKNTAAYIPEFISEVFDLSRIKDEEIRGETALKAQLLLQKYAGTESLPEILEQILNMVFSSDQDRNRTDYLEALLNYVDLTTDVGKLNTIAGIVDKYRDVGGEIMTTIAEKWMSEGEKTGRKKGLIEGKAEGRLEGKREGRLEGKREGRLEGKREGRLEGKREGKIEIARNMLQRGMNIEDIVQITGLEKRSIQGLKE